MSFISFTSLLISPHPLIRSSRHPALRNSLSPGTLGSTILAFLFLNGGPSLETVDPGCNLPLRPPSDALLDPLVPWPPLSCLLSAPRETCLYCSRLLNANFGLFFYN